MGIVSLDQVLRGGPLKPHQHVDRAIHAGRKDPIGVLGGLEQLVLLRLFLLFRLWFLLIAQGDEPIPVPTT
jgi:hypothetical protein